MIPATNPNLTDIGAGVATGPWGPYYILHAAYSVGPTVAPSRTPTRTLHANSHPDGYPNFHPAAANQHDPTHRHFHEQPRTD